VLRVISEFESVLNPELNTKDSLEHPESSAAEQNKFLKHLKAMCDLANEGTVVNPFRETGPELITLDTEEVMDPYIVQSLKDAANIGKSKFTEFVVSRIEKATKPFSHVIQRSNLFTFTNRPPTHLKKGSDKLGSAKANTALITRMFMSLQARPNADICNFFKYENQREPPSLSDRGKLRSGTKSDIVSCLPGMPGLGRTPAGIERLL